MHKIEFTHDKLHRLYYASMSDKKSCAIVFYEETSYNGNDLIYSVAFGVGTSRKQVLNLALRDKEYIKSKTTGDGSCKYMLFAYNAIIEFEKHIKEIHKNRNMSIEIGAEDERRWNIYKYYLNRIGYNEHRFNNVKFSKSSKLYKKIN